MGPQSFFFSFEPCARIVNFHVDDLSPIKANKSKTIQSIQSLIRNDMNKHVKIDNTDNYLGNVVIDLNQ